ncbi:MAG: BON domain-containing protein [Pirellulales bacterium]|nr:BON domain-containing protein [Pirellulales bacterium]
MEGAPVNTTKVDQTDTCDLAQAALLSSSVYDVRYLQVERRNGNLVIFGSVSKFYHKQLAQELVLGVSREINVINEIIVLNPPR